MNALESFWQEVQQITVATLPNNPLTWFKRPNGQVFVDGLFKLHDTFGFPLSCSIDQCNKQGFIPCTGQFVYDALDAGWTKERAERTVKEALADTFVKVPD